VHSSKTSARNCKARSAAAWPNLSLMPLKWSASIASKVKGEPFLREKLISRLIIVFK